MLLKNTLFNTLILVSSSSSIASPVEPVFALAERQTSSTSCSGGVNNPSTVTNLGFNFTLNAHTPPQDRIPGDVDTNLPVAISQESDTLQAADGYPVLLGQKSTKPSVFTLMDGVLTNPPNHLCIPVRSPALADINPGAAPEIRCDYTNENAFQTSGKEWFATQVCAEHKVQYVLGYGNQKVWTVGSSTGFASSTGLFEPDQDILLGRGGPNDDYFQLLIKA